MAIARAAKPVAAGRHQKAEAAATRRVGVCPQFPPPKPAPTPAPSGTTAIPLGEQRAAETGAVLVDRSHRGVLTLTGDDRQTWLHSISTQHVSELPDGASTQNLSLDGPGPGRRPLDPDRARRRHLSRHRAVARRAVAGLPAQDGVLVGRHAGPGRSGGAVAAGAAAERASGARRARLGRVARRDDGRADCPAAASCAGCRRPARARSSWTFWSTAREIRRAAAAVDRRRSAPGRSLGLRGPPGGGGAPTARRRHRRAHHPARSGLDRRRGAVHLDKGCYRGQETVARVHNLGKPPRMLVLLHLDGSVDRPATGDAVLAGGRAVGRLGTVVDHVDLGPVALALLKRGDTRRHRPEHRRRRRGGGDDRRRIATGRRRARRRSGSRRAVAGNSPMTARTGCGAQQHATTGHGKLSAGQ